MARDITEGDGNVWALADDGLPIARGVTEIGVTSTGALWQNTDIAYDVAVGGLPFIYAISDARPYIRQTAPFRKDQFDNGTEPGEQSLTGWWLRSQMSFHGGTGIKFYDPATTDENGHYRFFDSKNVNVWTKGQATLLKAVSAGHVTTGDLRANGRRGQKVRSIKWNSTPGVLLGDEFDVDKLDAAGNETHFINYNSGSSSRVFSICDDGTTAYWITNNATSGKLEMRKKPLTGSATSTADETSMFTSPGITVTNAAMDYVKERIVACINEKIYEISPAATALPTEIYTNPASTHVYTDIAAGPSAIYVSGFNGIQSSIQKFTLTTAGAMPTLTSAVMAAEFPAGELVHRIFYYLGYIIIGTSKGVRVASISDTDGGLTYGPLIVETSQPVFDFTARDHFVWCATGVDGAPGLTRIDLSNEFETLRFAYANDIYFPGVTGRKTTGCAFIDGTEQIIFTSQALAAGGNVVNKAKTSGVVTLTTSSAHGLSVGSQVWVEGVVAVGGSEFSSSSAPFTVASVPTTTTFTYALAGADIASTAVSSPDAKVNTPGAVYVESATELAETGYITTGNIRFGTLEPKNFKRLLGRGDFTYGSMTLETVDKAGVEYDHITYDAGIDGVEVTTNNPQTAQEYVAYKFVLARHTSDPTKGPVFKGYQAKATIATPRQRIMRFPVYCFDTETDRYNVMVGYEGRASERILALEDVEESGDVINWQDLSTGESRQAVIEQVTFTRMTPPDKRFDGFGGVIEITLRTV